MARELFERLVTVFNCAKADARIAPSFGWMQLTQGNHGLAARTADIDGQGRTIERVALPSSYERFALLVDWVERKAAPGPSIVLTGGARTLPLCSYPQYPRYSGGDASDARSYRCTVP